MSGCEHEVELFPPLHSLHCPSGELILLSPPGPLPAFLAMSKRAPTKPTIRRITHPIVTSIVIGVSDFITTIAHIAAIIAIKIKSRIQPLSIFIAPF